METQSPQSPQTHPRSAPSEAPPRGDGEAAVHRPVSGRLSDPAPRPSGHGWIWLLVFIAAVAVAGYFLYPKIKERLHAQAPGAGAARGPRDIAVVAITARKGELPLYINGLGTVTPFSTVTVRSRVDGEIMKVLFQEGQLVHEGDPLIEIDPRPYQVMLTQMEGQYARDAAQLKNAKLDLKRYTTAGVSAVGQQQIDTQEATVEQFEGVLKADQGQIDNVKLQLVYCHVTSPITGRIGLRQVDVGNIVHANDASESLAVITQLQPISVAFTIPQDSIGRIVTKPKGGEGMPVEAWNRDFTAKIAEGTLAAVNNQVDPQTGTIRLKGTFPNKDEVLFPSEFVNARLLVDTLKDVTIVPSAAIQRGPESAYVYAVKGDKTVELRNVKVGDTEGDQTVVVEGVAPGDVIVTDGVDKLIQGSKVTVRPPPAGGRSKGPTTGPSTAPSTRPASAHGTAQ